MLEPLTTPTATLPDSLPWSDRTSKQIAEQATIQSLLNCYWRETDHADRIQSADAEGAIASVLAQTGATEVIRCLLPQQQIQILAGIHYWSLTGRHQLAFPVFYQPINQSHNPEALLELDYVTLAALITKELSLSGTAQDGVDELLLRVIQSCQNIEQFVRSRATDAESLYRSPRSFRETEQSLILGHLLHPTPKSRQGWSDLEIQQFSPETQGEFALYYFRAHHSIVQEGSALPETATQLIKAQLQADPTVAESVKDSLCQADDYSLIPVHPWQARWLLQHSAVQAWIDQGLLQDLGTLGRRFYPTSSLRTVYHPESAFMLKLSLSIKITNSVRTNLYKELERGVEVSKILNSAIGQDLCWQFPNFEIIRDPAYITVRLPEETEASAFAAVLRANPFVATPEADVTCLIALCQDPIAGTESRLAQIIRQLATQENRSVAAVSRDWFRRYLERSLKPIFWLYFTYGIALEAHQQNSLIQLQNGYPERFFYRDNQGYYYRQSFHHLLNTIIPGISERSQTVCDDAVADERLAYYFVINNVFGLINAFGRAGLIDERSLLAEVRQVLAQITPDNTDPSRLLHNLAQPKLRSKANLLTRFHNLDELVGSLATQSVYREIDNPLVFTEVAESVDVA